MVFGTHIALRINTRQFVIIESSDFQLFALLKACCMKKIWLFLAVLFLSAPGNGQTLPTSPDSTVMLPEVKVKALWINDTDRYRYNQMKFYVTTILPYLDAATKLFKDINAENENPDVSRREKRQYVNAREEELRDRFEEKIKELNVTQGELLVKLISRQTELNIYKILLQFKNPLVAVKWQAWARLHGMNLDRKYHPEEEPRLENIMDELGYPLPAGYHTGLVTE
jgi:hypothetical protein